VARGVGGGLGVAWAARAAPGEASESDPKPMATSSKKSRRVQVSGIGEGSRVYWHALCTPNFT
jgi:hypothetical protein